MNRTDRLLAIILELQQRKGFTKAETLAATFEVSVRTMYRDMQALSEAGVPIVGVPGDGYSLVDGYFLPPLRFTTEEALMLILGSDFMAQNFDAQYQDAANAARRKIETVLPHALGDEVNYLVESISFYATATADNNQQLDILRQLRRAIIEQRSVRLDYQKRFVDADSNSRSIRDVNPYGLAHMGGAWYLMGYCLTRQAIRNFRLSRIAKVDMLEKRFARPPNFKSAWRLPDEARNLIVHVLFDEEAARWVRETPSFYTIDATERPEGYLVTLKIRRESEVLQWLLGWGKHVRVLEPESLRETLAAEATEILRHHAPGNTLLT